MTDLTNERLQAIIDAAGKATPGPWEIERFGHAPERSNRHVVSGGLHVCSTNARNDDNATHIANCDPQTITAMAGEVLRLRELYEEYQLFQRESREREETFARAIGKQEARAEKAEAENARLRAEIEAIVSREAETVKTAFDLQAENARLRAALSRQTDNIAFMLNRVSLPEQWFDKLDRELVEDRQALGGHYEPK